MGLVGLKIKTLVHIYIFKKENAFRCKGVVIDVFKFRKDLTISQYPKKVLQEFLLPH